MRASADITRCFPDCGCSVCALCSSRRRRVSGTCLWALRHLWTRTETGAPSYREMYAATKEQFLGSKTEEGDRCKLTFAIGSRLLKR
jgi:hypothetical protein